MSKLALGQRVFGQLIRVLPGMHRLPPNWVRMLFALTDRLNGLRRIALPDVQTLEITVSTDGNGAHSSAQQSISARIYRAEARAQAGQPSKLPTLVFYHSGGCVIGSVDTHDGFCRHLAKFAEVNVVSVDYRLAPEYKFPVPICDAIEAWNWVVEHAAEQGLNTKRMGVAGDSAGGYLSLLVGLQSLHQQLPVKAQRRPDFQGLLFPMLDLRAHWPSYEAFTGGLLLTKQLMLYFRDHYLSDPAQATLPLASPLLHDQLSECPPTYLLTVEFDPLRDEGRAMADKLLQSGVKVKHEHAQDCMHSFFSLTAISSTAKAQTRAVIAQLGKLARQS